MLLVAETSPTLLHPAPGGPQLRPQLCRNPGARQQQVPDLGQQTDLVGAHKLHSSEDNDEDENIIFVLGSAEL